MAHPGVLLLGSCAPARHKKFEVGSDLGAARGEEEKEENVEVISKHSGRKDGGMAAWQACVLGPCPLCKKAAMEKDRG